MNRSLLVLTALLTFACKKDTPTTAPPTTAPDTSVAPVVSEVPQEPDPAEIEQGATLYTTGHYQQAIDLLGPIYSDLKAREQYRAGGLAAAWLAVSHAQQGVFENAEEPNSHAQAMAERTQDPDVIAAARMSRGAYLLASEDYDAAVLAFEAATKSGPGTRAAAIAHVLLGEALINRAFGRDHNGTLERPQDLDAARTAYTAAAQAAAASDNAKTLTGRVEEGLAVVAKFKGDKATACKHALAAQASYKDSQASDLLVQGPDSFVIDEKCGPPSGGGS